MGARIRGIYGFVNAEVSFCFRTTHSYLDLHNAGNDGEIREEAAVFGQKVNGCSLDGF